MIHHLSDGTFLLFDSHSRDDKGMPVAEGKAVLLRFSGLNSVNTFFKNFAAKLDGDNIPYELMVIYRCCHHPAWSLI